MEPRAAPAAAAAGLRLRMPSRPASTSSTPPPSAAGLTQGASYPAGSITGALFTGGGVGFFAGVVTAGFVAVSVVAVVGGLAGNGVTVAPDAGVVDATGEVVGAGVVDDVAPAGV